MDEHMEYLEATRHRQETLATIPHALSARYDRRIGRIVIRLSTGLDIAFSPRDAQELETATWKQMENIVIEPPGFDLYFPDIDAGLYIPALLEGFLGSKKWMAAAPGRAGRQSEKRRKGPSVKREWTDGRQAKESS